MIKNKTLKRRIVEISYKLKLGHLGSCLTAVDIIDEIYKIKKPDEKFVLSAGHAHLAHLVVKEPYEIKKLNGTYLKEEFLIKHICDLIEKYGIHCDRKAGCDVSTGSLGHGIGIAVGMALTDRTKNVYCLLSDGELMEGSVHEAMRVIYDQFITNLKVYVNCNGYGAYRQLDFKSHPFHQMPWVEMIYTNMDDYPKWLQGQIAHYKVLNEQEYNELLDILK